jgi:hypothetical protein
MTTNTSSLSFNKIKIASSCSKAKSIESIDGIALALKFSM